MAPTRSVSPSAPYGWRITNTARSGASPSPGSGRSRWLRPWSRGGRLSVMERESRPQPSRQRVGHRDGAPVLIQPAEQLLDASRGQGDAGVCRAVVEHHRVTVRPDRVSTGKGDVADVALALISRLRPEDPHVAAKQTVIGPGEIQEREPQPIQAPGRGVPDAMIDHQPTARGLDQRWRKPNLVRIPPRPPPRLQHELVTAPVPEVRRIRNPDMGARVVHRPVH